MSPVLVSADYIIFHTEQRVKWMLAVAVVCFNPVSVAVDMQKGTLRHDAHVFQLTPLLPQLAAW